MRDRSRRLIFRVRTRGRFLVLLAAAMLATACESEADPALQPDLVLQEELGLTARDEVHRILVRGGAREVADPAETIIPAEAHVEFVTTDWLVHEVVFDVDNMSADSRAFLESTDQVASPPLLRQDSRFVIDFRDAPPGRYPYRLEGSGEGGRGVVIVVVKP